MKTFDIHKRIFIFVVNTLKIIKLIPQTVENKIIINQLIRSVTSCGANDQEADGVSTKRDFIHCYTIVRKELKETHYWLLLLITLNSNLEKQINPLLQENSELIKIVSAIISKAGNKSDIKSTNKPIIKSSNQQID